MPSPAPRSGFVVVPLLTALVTAPLSAQESRAVLFAPMAVLPVDSAPFQRLGDFDGDGDLDAIGSRIHESGGSIQLAAWRNDGGAFTLVQAGPWGSGLVGTPAPRTAALATADFDLDGRMDFVACAGPVLTRFYGQPTMLFSSVTEPLPWSKRGYTVAADDFDGDGLPDVAIAWFDSGSTTGALQVRLASGTTLTEPFQSTALGPLHLQALDLDPAPGIELLLNDRATGTARVYGVQNGNLIPLQTLTTQLNYLGATPWLWTGGDLDGDQDVDLVVFKPELGTNGIPHYQIFRRTGASSFTAEPIAIGGPAEYLADIDGDGDLDGVCCGGGGPIYDWPMLDFASNFEISQNRGNGDFARAWTFAGAGSESMAGVADLDGDGDLDFVAGRCVFHGDGPWREHPMPPAGGTNVTIVARPWDPQDLDGDGDIDFGRFTTNRGDGVFAPSPPPPAAPAGFQFAGAILCDVDGDGTRDIVRRLLTYNPPQPAQFVSMTWQQNNGGGHFRNAGPASASGVQVGTGVTADSALAADCDGDGDEDIIANTQSTSGDNPWSQVFWNVDRDFQPGPVFDLFSGGRVDAVADFDADGLPDLLMHGALAGVHVRRGTGIAIQPFAPVWATAPMPYEPAAVAVGDLNDDGRLDFVRPDSLGQPVLFVNTTPPGSNQIQFAMTTLAAPRIILAPHTASAPVRSTITVGDFDGDGRTDIALGRIVGEPNVGVVLRRTAWSTPPSIADYEVVRHTFVDGFAADVDLDGDTDLVGTCTTRSRRFGATGGRRIQLHDGVAGEDGAVPVLGGTGPYRAGETEVLRLTGVPGPTIAILGMSLAEATLPGVPFPGLTLHLAPESLVIASWPITENGGGRAAAGVTASLYLVPGLEGLSFHLQAFVFDLAAPNLFSQSNVMVKTVGW